MTSVAVFTDIDIDAISDHGIALKAMLQYADCDVQPRIFTTAGLETDVPEYYAAASFRFTLPGGAHAFWPRLHPFARQLRGAKAQVVHIATPGPVGLAGRWLAHRLGLPAIGSYHAPFAGRGGNLDATSSHARLLERYGMWIYDRCDPLLVPSSTMRERLVRRRYPVDRLRLWALGVDSNFFTPDRASRSLRASWHVDDRRPAILYAGPLSRPHDVQIIEPIQRALYRRGIAHRFIFIGGRAVRSQLQEICPDGEFVADGSRDRIATVMASADVCLRPVPDADHQHTLLEAQASGLPVISVDLGAPQEYLVPDVTGEICQAGNSDDAIAHLIPLLRNKQRRQEMGRAARDYARRRDWTSALAPVFDTWRRAAAGRDSARDLGEHASRRHRADLAAGA